MTKSKLGRQSISPPKKDRYEKKDSLDFIEDLDSSNMMTNSKPFYFDKNIAEESVPSVTMTSKLQNPELSATNDLSPRSKKKMYFKMAKTMHLFST